MWSLVMLAVSSLGLAESRILPAASVDTRPRTPLISFCTVQLRTLCAAHSLPTLCLSMTSGPDPGKLPGFWGSMVSRHAPIPGKGSGSQQYQHITDGFIQAVAISAQLLTTKQKIVLLDSALSEEVAATEVKWIFKLVKSDMLLEVTII